MKIYIKFHEHNPLIPGGGIISTTFGVSDTFTIAEAIEQALYTLYELVPRKDRWFGEFERTNRAIFIYEETGWPVVVKRTGKYNIRIR